MSQRADSLRRLVAVGGLASLLALSSRAQGSVEPGPVFPPPNDSFTNATELDGYFIETHGTNLHATAEPGEPHHAGSFATRSVWWKWTAPDDGMVEIQSTVTLGLLVPIVPVEVSPNSVGSRTVMPLIIFPPR